MKRTPKNYNGTAIPSKKIKHVLQDFLEATMSRNKGEKAAVFKAWYAIIGPEMREYTSPTSFYEGILYVRVKTHVLYSVLSTTEKTRLLQEMQRTLAKHLVKNIRFRIG